MNFQTTMAQAETMIMHPLNTTALILGRRLIHADHDLSMNCPEDVHKWLVSTISADLAIEALGMTSEVNEVDTLENFQSFNYVVSPALDLAPSEARNVYALLCKGTFRYKLSQ